MDYEVAVLSKCNVDAAFAKGATSQGNRTLHLGNAGSHRPELSLETTADENRALDRAGVSPALNHDNPTPSLLGWARVLEIGPLKICSVFLKIPTGP